VDSAGRVSQAEYHASLDRRDRREAEYRARVAELEAALRSVLDTERDHYACASERNRRFSDARVILEKR
jgi:hypothetical protein